MTATWDITSYHESTDRRIQAGEIRPIAAAAAGALTPALVLATGGGTTDRLSYVTRLAPDQLAASLQRDIYTRADTTLREEGESVSIPIAETNLGHPLRQMVDALTTRPIAGWTYYGVAHELTQEEWDTAVAAVAAFEQQRREAEAREEARYEQMMQEMPEAVRTLFRRYGSADAAWEAEDERAWALMRPYDFE